MRSPPVDSATRTEASPVRLMAPSRSVSPDWHLRGVRPKQAPAFLEDRKRSGWSAAARNVMAMMAPAPGVVISLRQRRGAKVALARKLGVVLHAMWIKETDFRFTRPTSV